MKYSTLPRFGVPSFLSFVLSILISSLIVILALLLNNLTQPSPDWTVDTDHCTCDCWDRKFKGGYHPGGYKHVYFQMTTGTSLLWLWTAAHFIFFFKFVELATVCVLGSLFGKPRAPKVRWLVLFSSCLSFFGIFYNWWCTFNYINDAPPNQPYHILLPTQLFFDVTDLIPGIALYTLLQNQRPKAHGFVRDDEYETEASSSLYTASMAVSTAHLVLSMWDQGFVNLLTLKGSVARDVMFILSDLASLIGVGWTMRSQLWKTGRNLKFGIVGLVVIYLLLKQIVGYR